MSATDGYRVCVLCLHTAFMAASSTSWQPVGPVFATRDAALVAGSACYGLMKYGENWTVVAALPSV